MLQSASEGVQFVTRGSHSVITACTLPPWTPSAIVDAMVKHFSAMLRRDLITLKAKGFKRSRSNSTGSDSLSRCSDDSHEGGPHNISRRRKRYADLNLMVKFESSPAPL